MNRTAEFLNFAKENGAEESKVKNRTKEDASEKEETFYDKIYRKVLNFNVDVNTYTNFLKKEVEFNKLQKETVDLFKVVELESNDDLKMHFDGIKKIILTKLSDKKEEIEIKKKRFINKNIHLEPEKPFVYLTAHQDKKLEYENKMIMKETQSFDYQMKKTKKSLQDIKQIQDQISIHLNVQGETIDQIFNKSKNIGTQVKGANKFLKMGKERKRVMRRVLFIWLMCISFILLFLHLNY